MILIYNQGSTIKAPNLHPPIKGGIITRRMSYPLLLLAYYIINIHEIASFDDDFDHKEGYWGYINKFLLF